MKFYYLILNRTPLHIAIEKDNAEIIKLLVENEQFDPNIKYISLFFVLSRFKFNKLIQFRNNFF